VAKLRVTMRRKLVQKKQDGESVSEFPSHAEGFLRFEIFQPPPRGPDSRRESMGAARSLEGHGRTGPLQLMR
jgi:hypothetical protein